MKSHVHLLLLGEVQYITILSRTLKRGRKRWIEGLLSVDIWWDFFPYIFFVLHLKLRDCHALLAMTGYSYFLESPIKKGTGTSFSFMWKKIKKKGLSPIKKGDRPLFFFNLTKR